MPLERGLVVGARFLLVAGAAVRLGAREQRRRVARGCCASALREVVDRFVVLAFLPRDHAEVVPRLPDRAVDLERRACSRARAVSCGLGTAEAHRAHRGLELFHRGWASPDRACAATVRPPPLTVARAAAAAARRARASEESASVFIAPSPCTISGFGGRSPVRSLLRDSRSGGNLSAASRPSASRIFAVYSS